MTPAEQRIADLEGQVAGLAADFERLRTQAFMFKAITEMRLDRQGYRPSPRRARPRPSYLHSVGGAS
jgi:hypothetical protein